VNDCIRVHYRIECPECGYPSGESRYLLEDYDIPHGTPACLINCSGGCPVCWWDDHTVECVANYLRTQKCICVPLH
jgi:hypothetical protein